MGMAGESDLKESRCISFLSSDVFNIRLRSMACRERCTVLKISESDHPLTQVSEGYA